MENRTKHKRPVLRPCIYVNEYVRCASTDRCEHCGWNPAVAQRRSEIIYAKLQEVNVKSR